MAFLWVAPKFPLGRSASMKMINACWRLLLGVPRTGATGKDWPGYRGRWPSEQILQEGGTGWMLVHSYQKRKTKLNQRDPEVLRSTQSNQTFRGSRSPTRITFVFVFRLSFSLSSSLIIKLSASL